MVNMCPDRQIVSVYFDNELGSPWKEKFEAHLDGCSQCRKKLEAYRSTRESFSAAFPGMEEAKERLWESITSAAQVRRPVISIGNVWRRSFTIPVPAAAAAGLILVLTFALLLVLRPGTSDERQLAGLGMEVQGTQVSDMGSLLQYLSSDTSADMVIIKLPETTFAATGEPKILRAADYSRSGRTR
jgi:anti-sigma factor RsiW